MYYAKLHPEQYSDTFSDAQLEQLHDSILHVTKIAVDTLGDSEKFPEDWLFKHRWGKGKKDHATEMPNGAKITFITVGGRTSAVVPSVQKKTGAVAGDVKVENEDGEELKKNIKSPKVTKKKAAEDEAKEEDVKPKGKKRKLESVEKEEESKNSRASGAKSAPKVSSKSSVDNTGSNRRRSTRVSSKG